MSLYNATHDMPSTNEEVVDLSSIARDIDEVLEILEPSLEQQQEINLYHQAKAADPNQPSQKFHFLKLLLKSRLSRDNQTRNRLLAQLQGHVDLLYSLCQDQKLAGLFLISQGGTQQFEKDTKAILHEQAQRLQLAINNFPEVDSTNVLKVADYLKNFQSFIRANLENHDIDEVKSGFRELASLFETATLINDKLLQRKSPVELEAALKETQDSNMILLDRLQINQDKETKMTTELDILHKKNVKLQAQLDDFKKQLANTHAADDVINSVHQELKNRERENQILKDKINEITKIQRKTSQDLSQKSASLHEENLKLNSQIKDLLNQVEYLNNQLKRSQADVNAKDEEIAKNEETINYCKQKLNECENLDREKTSELKELQKIYQSASDQIQSLQLKRDENQLKFAKLMSQIQRIEQENEELKSSLANSQNALKDQIADADVILKKFRSMPPDQTPELESEIRKLRNQLNEAQSLIESLRSKIAKYKQLTVKRKEFDRVSEKSKIEQEKSIRIERSQSPKVSKERYDNTDSSESLQKERERIEREKHEKERLEREQFYRERYQKEKENAEKAKLEKEKLLKERYEQDKEIQERERKLQEKLERENLEKQKALKELQEKTDNERLMKEKLLKEQELKRIQKSKGKKKTVEKPNEKLRVFTYKSEEYKKRKAAANSHTNNSHSYASDHSNILSEFDVFEDELNDINRVLKNPNLKNSKKSILKSSRHNHSYSDD